MEQGSRQGTPILDERQKNGILFFMNIERLDFSAKPTARPRVQQTRRSQHDPDNAMG
jgi:hypothetical protein